MHLNLATLYVLELWIVSANQDIDIHTIEYDFIAKLCRDVLNIIIYDININTVLFPNDDNMIRLVCARQSD